jgi:hypothetical protein
MEQSTYEDLLNDTTAPLPQGGIIAPTYSINDAPQVAPKTAFEKLRYMAQKKLAKTDKFSIDAIGGALEKEITRRNGN